MPKNKFDGFNTPQPPKMQKIGGEWAIKILEWVFFNLIQIEEEDLTTFEKQLLERIKEQRQNALLIG